MCPQTATITSVPTATAGQKAKATQYNTLRDNYRGHLLCIDPTLAAAANGSYDLGSSDHQWRRAYLTEVPYVNGTQLGSLMDIAAIYDGTNPADLLDPSMDAYQIGFPEDLDRDMRFSFRIQDSYTAGRRIGVQLRGYSDTTGNFVIETVARRVVPNSTAFTGTTMILTSTATVTAASVSGQYFSFTQNYLTELAGTLGTTAVAVNDMIMVNLKRRGTHASDTHSGYFFLTDVIVNLNA